MSDKPTTPTVPSDPNTPWSVLIGTLIRGILYFLSAAGVTWSQTVSGSQIELAVAAIIFLGTFGWSFYQKAASAIREHQIAVMSARGGKAVQPEKVVP